MFTATDWIRDKNGLMVLTPFPIKWAGKAAKQVYHKFRQKDTINAKPPREVTLPGGFLLRESPQNLREWQLQLRRGWVIMKVSKTPQKKEVPS